jgi:hypothetical protein
VSGLPELRLHLLGGLDVEGIGATALGSRKARTLVKVLALGRGGAVPADRVVDALWPGDDLPARPVDQVGVLVSRLRSVLGADRLRRLDAGWSLAVDWFDVAELEARVDEAAARMMAGNPGAARAAAGPPWRWRAASCWVMIPTRSGPRPNALPWPGRWLGRG